MNRRQQVPSNRLLIGLLSILVGLLVVLLGGIGYLAYWGYNQYVQLNNQIQDVYESVVTPIHDQLGHLTRWLSRLLPTAEVSIHDGQTIEVSSEKAATLVTYIHQYQDSLTYKDRFMLSTKSVEVRGEFRVLFGFNIQNQQLRLKLSPDGKQIDCSGLIPEVIAVELLPHTLAYKTEHGWINRVDDQDITNAGKELLNKVRREMESNEALKERAVSSFLDYVRSVSSDRTVRMVTPQ